MRLGTAQYSSRAKAILLQAAANKLTALPLIKREAYAANCRY